MDQSTLIKRRAAGLWTEASAGRHGASLRGAPDAPPLRALLEDLAERACGLSVVEDDSLAGSNIEGELNREDGLILLRPGLDPHRANFVLAHEIGHFALDHPLRMVQPDTDQQIDTTVTADDLSAARQQRITGLDISDAALTALRGYSERETYEMQANAFAAELLVPGDELRLLLSEDPNRSVAGLAEHFGVPSSQVRVGMAQTLFAPFVSAAEAAGEGEASLAAPALDAGQQEAAGCSAPALVIAGPGAGKTRILVARYAGLVAGGENPHSILALTFANKAAGEMRERLAALVGPEQAASVEVFTFHAFGLQLLQQYGERIGLQTPLRLITPMDALLLFRRYAARRAYGFLSDLPKAMENLRRQLNAVARSKEEAAGWERWEQLAQEWQAAHLGDALPEWATDGLAFYEQYQAALRRHGLLDYGDLQTEALRLFDDPDVAAEIRARYRHVLVDEFQDINYVSGRLVRALDGGRGVVWVVGDPRQSIYGFRGASPVNLSRFRSPEYYPAARIVPLTINYRSVPDIVAAGAAVPVPVAGNDPDLVPPLLRAARSAADPLPAVTSAQLPDAESERRWLVAQIAAERAAGRPLSHIAVLVRKNKHAVQIADALTAAGIPHRWGGPLHERPVFRVLASALLLAADDAHAILGLTTLSPGAGLAPDFPLTEPDHRALFAEGRGRWRARRLLRAAATGEIAGLSDEGRAVCGALRAVAEALSATARPHHNLCVYLFEHARWLRVLLPERARADFAVAALLATTGQVLDLASGFAAQRSALARTASRVPAGTPAGEGASADDALDTGDTSASTEAFLAYIDAALESGDLGVPNELPAEGAEAVALLTAHRSKGLEWPVVFVPFCVEGQFPNQEQGSDLPLPPGLIATDDTDAAATHAREEACLFYVAVTRAEDRLYLCGADSYGPRTKGILSPLRADLEAALRAAGRLDSPAVDAAALPPLPARRAAARSDVPPIPQELPAELYEGALNVYERCPRQFLYGQIYGLPQPGSAFLDFYGAVYNAARDAGGDPAKLREAFRQNWEKDGPDPSAWQAPLLRKTAERLVDGMARKLEAGRGAASTAYRQPKTLNLALPDGTTQAIRFTLDEEAQGTDGRRVFRRHKQSATPPKTAPDDDRATLYALFADQEAGTGGAVADVEVAFHYPHTVGANAAADLPARIGAKKRSNRREELKQLVLRMKQGDLAPTPGPACAGCAYRLVCSRGAD